ncbi:hypothetical protein LWI28_012211 [Acer negundo]|uniref:Uncharacterized protein n=1 Tax=Acer negundo TaxID=4023 RepID=A0AAD5IPW9_ACENE|nr:hypothetical protein LWI28_012211 [Acer negundo]
MAWQNRDAVEPILATDSNSSSRGLKLSLGFLESGQINSFYFSLVAFSSAKGLDLEWCKVPEIGFLAPDLVLYLDMPPEMVDACQRIEDVQKQQQKIVLDHVLACQQAIFVAERVADERCEPSPGSDGSLVGYEVRLDSAIYSYSGVAFSSAKGVDLEWCKAPKIGLLALDLVLHLDMPPELL